VRLDFPIRVFFVLLFIFGCSRLKNDLSVDDLQERYDRGIEFLEKKKYYRSQQEFENVLLRGSHTELGDDAQFYLAEAYFLNKEYLLAISEYDRLVRQMSYSPYVESSRFRICQSYENKSPKFFHDQEYTQNALDKLQEFIEDYPTSEYLEDAIKMIHLLRSKLAQKEYEAAVLYIKMEEYDSAINYLQDLLASYYDTDYADMARLKIVDAFLRARKTTEAENFFEQNESKFKDKNLLRETKVLISNTRNRGILK